jgi:hypothetical protein
MMDGPRPHPHPPNKATRPGNQAAGRPARNAPSVPLPSVTASRLLLLLLGAAQPQPQPLCKGPCPCLHCGCSRPSRPENPYAARALLKPNRPSVSSDRQADRQREEAVGVSEFRRNGGSPVRVCVGADECAAIISLHGDHNVWFLLLSREEKN